MAVHNRYSYRRRSKERRGPDVKSDVPEKTCCTHGSISELDFYEDVQKRMRDRDLDNVVALFRQHRSVNLVIIGQDASQTRTKHGRIKHTHESPLSLGRPRRGASLPYYTRCTVPRTVTVKVP